MPNFYPALKAHMGSWDYYVVKMAMKDVVKEVGFASEIYANKTLDDAIQRSLNEHRVKREIVEYLAHRTDRFFSSLVVAALGGNPKFWPVDLAEDPKFDMLKSTGFENAFGVLTFDGGQRYFALDGQHRLKSIKTLIEQQENNLPAIPPNFADEEMSVIMLVRQEEDEAEFMRGYRRIFSSLNRYAKPTDRDTNIIMDEDDAIAILTRRLLTEHEFFAWEGGPASSPKLKTKGKSLRSGDSYFTTLQTLYSMNEVLLTTPTREVDGFGSKLFKQFRPPEETLDDLFDELVLYWNALLEEVKVLREDPAKMRAHGVTPDDEELSDHLLFWPIGQEMFASVVRMLLNKRLPDADSPALDGVKDAISCLAALNWDLRSPPWEGLLLVQDLRKETWTMRNEDRKQAIVVSTSILRMLVGLDELTEEGLADLKLEWHSMLIPQPSRGYVDAHWDQIVSVAHGVRG